MRILLFAGLAEACGARALEVAAPPEISAAELRRAAERACPALAGRVFRVAINGRYADAEERVPPSAEVAFLPPVSGG